MPTTQQAVLWTVAYADVFDYPLTLNEVHRYLWGLPATRKDVADILRPGRHRPLGLSHVTGNGDLPRGGYYTLPGREAIAGLRTRRERMAARLWTKAWSYAQWIARLPFVRMVALTGSLAMGNVERNADIDYLIITEPNRLWLCRACVVALTLCAARRGDTICPNYFLSENALALRERNLYTAREFAQMIPLYGLSAYQHMRACNPWVRNYLPNAKGPPDLATRMRTPDARDATLAAGHEVLKSVAEGMLRTPPFGRLEAWEMRRKLRKFNPQREFHPESGFGPDWCKGHFNDHMTRTLDAFSHRLQRLGGEGPRAWMAEAIALT
ncbi:MAG: hypothetical protein M1546_04990 [Chloroflexi bacterium]|nr:hypothetical protein [Chloroflexota bacterium]